MSGLLGKLPQRHFTARAEWWLRHSTVIMPREYPKSIPVGLASCVQHRARRLYLERLDLLMKSISPATMTELDVLRRHGQELEEDSQHWWSQAKMTMESEGIDTRCIRGWSCGAQDVRSHYINMMTTTVDQPGAQTIVDHVEHDNEVRVPFAIHAEPMPGRAEAYGPIERFVYTIREAMMPTCQECIVHFDKAMESYTPKTGRYPTKVTNNHTLSGWKELK